jgi:hypothetical protein
MRQRVLIGVVVLMVALASAATASGKDEGPVRIVAESGKVGWLRGASANAWWTDLYGGRSGVWCACSSPTEVSKFEQRVFGHARWKVDEDGSWPTGMLLIQSGHSAAWLYYPASRTTPPYLVAPAGSGSQHLRWDDWRRVTPRMQRLITAALKQGTVTTYTGGSTAFPTGWAIGGGLGALLVGLILSVWRTPSLARALKHARYRPSL